MTTPRKKKPPMSEENSRTISAKWSVSIPVALIVISAIATNLGMYYSMDGKTAVLDTKVEMIQRGVSEIKTAVQKLSVDTSAEVRSIRREQEATKEKLNIRITALRIELATVKGMIPKADRDSDRPK